MYQLFPTVAQIVSPTCPYYLQASADKLFLRKGLRPTPTLVWSCISSTSVFRSDQERLASGLLSGTGGLATSSGVPALPSTRIDCIISSHLPNDYSIRSGVAPLSYQRRAPSQGTPNGMSALSALPYSPTKYPSYGTLFQHLSQGDIMSVNSANEPHCCRSYRRIV